jgi:hypothetical protein
VHTFNLKKVNCEKGITGTENHIRSVKEVGTVKQGCYSQSILKEIKISEQEGVTVKLVIPSNDVMAKIKKFC